MSLSTSSDNDRDRLFQRIADLEQENAALRVELDHLCTALQAMIGNPLDDEEQSVVVRAPWRVIQGGRA